MKHFTKTEQMPKANVWTTARWISAPKPTRHAFRHIHALFFFFFKTYYRKQYYILTKACQII